MATIIVLSIIILIALSIIIGIAASCYWPADLSPVLIYVLFGRATGILA